MTQEYTVAEARSALVHALNDYWQLKRAGRIMPRRADIDPADLKRLLPYLMMGDIEHEPFRVRFRLVGTRLAAIHGFDFTGLYLDQIDFGPGDQEDWLALNRRIVERRAPLFGKSSTPCSDGRSIAFEFATFPLSDDELTVNRWIGIEDYGPLDAMTIARMEKARRRSP